MLLCLLTHNAEAAVSFTNEIAPIFVQKCVACHDDKKAKGGFQLDTYPALMSTPKDQPAVVPGQPERSKLYELLTTANADDRMPQKDDPLPPEQIASVRRWIEAGAKFDGADPKVRLTDLVQQVQPIEPPAEYPFPVPVTALTFSADGKELVSSGYHELLIWDADTGTLRRRIKGLPQKIQDVAFSPDGQWLVAATGVPGKLGQVNVIGSDNAVQVLARSSDLFLAVCFDADGSTLAAGGADNSIRVFEWAKREQILKIEQHADWVLDVVFHPDGKEIVSASRDKTVRLIESSRGELESTYQGHTEAVFATAVSPKGNRIYTAGRDKKVHIWEPKEAKKVGEITGFNSDIYRLLVVDDRLFVAGADRTIFAYRIKDENERVRTYAGHRDAVFALAVSRDGKRLASGSYDGEIRVWDVESGELARTFIAAPGLDEKRQGAAAVQDAGARLVSVRCGEAFGLRQPSGAFSRDGHHSTAGSKSSKRLRWSVLKR